MHGVCLGRAGKVCFRKVCEISEVGERPAAIHPGFQGTSRSLLYEVREVTVKFVFSIKELTKEHTPKIGGRTIDISYRKTIKRKRGFECN